MSTAPLPPDELTALLEDSLQLARQYNFAPGTVSRPSVALPSLFAQLTQLSGDIRARPSEPVRIIHHLACTGGTLISKYLAAMPNVRLLSEIDPLSPISKQGFNPLNLALQYQQAASGASDQDLIDIFQAGLQVIYQKCLSHGERLLLRSHCHSHFNTGATLPDRPTLAQIIRPVFPVRSVLTVRHPLDSYLSVVKNKFVHFTPGTLDEYAKRYLAFLDAHHDTAVIKYEDFVTDHEAYGQRLCAHLDLVWSPSAVDIFPALTLTGDSGRSGTEIAARGRRSVPEEIKTACENSTNYHSLCTRLEYQV